MVMKKSVFACLLVFVLAFSSHAQTKSTATEKAPEVSYNPVADPQAVVAEGNARFTVLTPQLIRMEWSADGKFEDHPSFVFLNRRLAVPKFTHSEEGGKLTIQTSALQLTYTGSGKF